MKGAIDKKRSSQHSSIQNTLVLALMLVIIPLFALSTWMGAESLNATRDQINLSYSNALRMNSLNLHDRLKDIDSFVISLLISDEVNALTIAKKDLSILYDLKLMENSLKLRTSGWQMEANITMILPGCPWIVSTKYGVEPVSAYPEIKIWWDGLDGNDGWRLESALHKPEERCYTLNRGYTHAKQTSAVIRVEIDGQALLTMLNDTAGDLSVAAYYLIDEKGGWLSSADVDEPLRNAYASYQQDGTSANSLNQSGKHFYALFSALDNDGGAIGVLLEEGKMLGRVSVIRNQMLVLIFFFIALSSVFYRLTSLRIVHPLHKLLSSMQKVEKGDLNVRVEYVANDDIGRMGKRFNSMVSQLQELIRNQYDKQLQLHEAQLRFLRAQINPHFLYNCLYTLYALIQNEDIENASDLTIFLGQYYQLSAHSEKQEVELGREMEQVRLYLKIQSMRYREKLTYEEYVEEPLLSLKIPSFSLLTLVENTVVHGMQCTHPVLLRISAQSTEEGAVLTVSDNGVGMTAEEMDKLIRELRQPLEENAEVHGIQNIWRRLCLHCNGRARIELAANQPNGMIVRLILPNRKELENHV